MAGLANRPLIFVDVDGPLIPFKARPVSRERSLGGAIVQPLDGTGNPLLDRLDPDDGRRLLALRCQLVWATTWMAEANAVISPRLGLPDLPVVRWPDDDEDPEHGLHWKTVFLTRWAAGRPFVWLDDELTDADRRWVAAHHPVRALLQRVDPYVGLTEADSQQSVDGSGRLTAPIDHPPAHAADKARRPRARSSPSVPTVVGSLASYTPGGPA